ncbi:alpha/beta hydrolase family esterase [Hydrogenophaga sp. UC242_50]|uniref:alpha/beta hydrolase family esterase n=1 Tax=Hydrogenophaga sp. UC242_50 TaxID=3350169 RepID=UPI0036D20FE5
MARRRATSTWVKAFNRNLRAMARAARQLPRAPRVARAKATRGVRTGPGDWLPGLALGPGGARRYRLYRPPDLPAQGKVPLLVMLHGCGQDSAGFAASTRMNALARREGFLVLYPEQDRLAHPQRCWNWYDTRSGRAQAEASLILAMIDQATLLYPVDPARIALAGLSAGAGMAALLRHARARALPGRGDALGRGARGGRIHRHRARRHARAPPASAARRSARRPRGRALAHHCWSSRAAATPWSRPATARPWRGCGPGNSAPPPARPANCGVASATP